MAHTVSAWRRAFSPSMQGQVLSSGQAQHRCSFHHAPVRSSSSDPGMGAAPAMASTVFSHSARASAAYASPAEGRVSRKRRKNRCSPSAALRLHRASASALTPTAAAPPRTIPPDSTMVSPHPRVKLRQVSHLRPSPCTMPARNPPTDSATLRLTGNPSSANTSPAAMPPTAPAATPRNIPRQSVPSAAPVTPTFSPSSSIRPPPHSSIPAA